MKRLKFRHPYRGYEGRVLTASALISPLLTFAALTLSDNRKVSLVLPFMLMSFILTLILAYLIMSHTNAEEKYLIEQAEEYNWQSLDDRMYTAVQNKYKMPWFEITIVTVLIAVSLICLALTMNDVGSLLPGLAVGGGIIALMLIFYAVRRKLWYSIDESAEYTVLKAHHTYSVKWRGRNGSVYIDEYYVFYTPDGRIVLKKECSNCNKVCVIRFNKMITYVEYAEKRRYNYSRL